MERRQFLALSIAATFPAQPIIAAPAADTFGQDVIGMFRRMTPAMRADAVAWLERQGDERLRRVAEPMERYRQRLDIITSI